MKRATDVHSVLRDLLAVSESTEGVDNGPQYIINQLVEKYPEVYTYLLCTSNRFIRFIDKAHAIHPQSIQHTINTHVDTCRTNKNKIFKFVLTGGPCGGKTTAMARLQGYLKERGYRVFIVPEASTMFLNHGATFDDFANPKCPWAFQQFIIRTQISLEDSMENYARATGENCIILCDRGCMDGAAYMKEEDFEALLVDVGIDMVTARDIRYNAVFHLVTAADGAADFYTLSNNAARNESVEEAVVLDRKTQQCWAGHPHHIIIGNEGVNFDQKLQQLVGRIASFVGLPSHTKEQSHKYILHAVPDFSDVENVQEFMIEKVILANDPNSGDVLNSMSGSSYPLMYRFIRKRTQGSMHAYGMTSVYQQDDGKELELKQIIAPRVYRQMLGLADPNRHKIIQKRSYFLWEKQSLYVNEYIAPVTF